MKKQNISTTNEIWTIFGERLKTELERQGISLRQFADKAGLTLNTACRYAHSQRTPRATEILKAAEVLHVTSDYMLGLSDDPHKTRDGWEKAGFHELPSAQPETHDKRTETHACDLISRQWLMECVNEGWIKFDTKKDENRFIHLVRDIAPSAQQDIEEDEDIPMEYFENGGI